MNKKLSAAAFMVIHLSGCATQNIPGTAAYSPIPNSQILSPINDAGQEAASILVKRDPGFLGSGLSSVFTIDGRRIVKLKPGQFFELKLAPGEHLFGVDWSDDLGAIETGTRRELATKCVTGVKYIFRLFPQNLNGLAIERTSD